MLLIIQEEEIPEAAREATLEEILNYTIDAEIKSTKGALELITYQEMVNKQDLPVGTILLIDKANNLALNRLIYLHEDQVRFSATYFTPNTEYFDDLVAYSFNTFYVESDE